MVQLEAVGEADDVVDVKLCVDENAALVLVEGLVLLIDVEVLVVIWPRTLVEVLAEVGVKMLVVLG